MAKLTVEKNEISDEMEKAAEEKDFLKAAELKVDKVTRFQTNTTRSGHENLLIWSLCFIKAKVDELDGKKIELEQILESAKSVEVLDKVLNTFASPATPSTPKAVVSALPRY